MCLVNFEFFDGSPRNSLSGDDETILGSSTKFFPADFETSVFVFLGLLVQWILQLLLASPDSGTTDGSHFSGFQTCC